MQNTSQCSCRNICAQSHETVRNSHLPNRGTLPIWKRWTRGLRPGTWHRMPAEVRRRRDSQSNTIGRNVLVGTFSATPTVRNSTGFTLGCRRNAPRPGSHRWQLFADHRTYVCVSALAKYESDSRSIPKDVKSRCKSAICSCRNILRSPTVPEVPVGRSRRLHVRCSQTYEMFLQEHCGKLRHCLRQQEAVIFENRCNTPTLLVA